MDSGTPIFDISSDEEPAFAVPGVCDDDYNWLTEVLENFDKKTNDDSDEVVVVGEYNPPKPKSKTKLKSSKSVKSVEDDDCVVLDCDPEKSVAVNIGAAGDGDDVLLVAEKGQVACRDYPHSRHFCAKFPFSSTPHERHCDLCHCYVCDSLAPCAYWGTGLSSIDHCHATDKQEMWKIQRENFRLNKKGQLLGSKFTNNHLPMAVAEINQNLPLEIAQLGSNSIPQNQVSRPTAIRACSSIAQKKGAQNIVCEGRNWRSRRLQELFKKRRLQGNIGIPPCPLSQQSLGRRNHAIQQRRGPNLGDLRQQIVPNNANFTTTVRGAPLTNGSVYGSSNGLNYTPATCSIVSTASLATPRNRIPAGRHNIVPNIGLESYVQSSSQFIRASSIANSVPFRTAHSSIANSTPSRPAHSSISNSMPSEPAVSSQPLPQLNDGQSTCQLGNGSQTVMDPSFFDVDFGWIDNLGEINHQTSVENDTLQDTTFNNEPSTVNSQLTEGCQLMKDDEYQSWTLGQSVPVNSEGCVATNLNVFSPEPPAIDAGMLYFDFETSWNGLARA